MTLVSKGTCIYKRVNQGKETYFFEKEAPSQHSGRALAKIRAQRQQATAKRWQCLHRNL